MYSTKRGRSSAARQTADALSCLLDERSSWSGSTTGTVAALAKATAEAMRLSEPEVREIERASFTTWARRRFPTQS